MITKMINQGCSCPIHWAKWKRVLLFLLVMFVAAGGLGLINQATTKRDVVAPFMGQSKSLINQATTQCGVAARFIGPDFMFLNATSVSILRTLSIRFYRS